MMKRIPAKKEQTRVFARGNRNRLKNPIYYLLDSSVVMIPVAEGHCINSGT